MSRQQWKIIALSLTTLLISLLVLFSVPPLDKVLVQASSLYLQCRINPTDWIANAAQSLGEKYGAGICERGKFEANEVETRADIAGWLAKPMDGINEILSDSMKDLAKKSELDSLNQLLDQITAEVEALERR
jgi:hypothetical protein